MKIKDLAQKLKELRERKAELTEELKEVNREIEHIARNELPEAMEEAGVEKVAFEGIGTIYLTTGLQVSVKDMEAVTEKLKEMGAEDLVKETVHPSTLKAFVKESLEAGEELPFSDEELSVWVYEQATIRKR